MHHFAKKISVFMLFKCCLHNITVFCRQYFLRWFILFSWPYLGMIRLRVVRPSTGVFLFLSRYGGYRCAISFNVLRFKHVCVLKFPFDFVIIAFSSVAVTCTLLFGV